MVPGGIGVSHGCLSEDVPVIVSGMMIRICVREQDPVAGEVVLDDDDAVAFTGWLGLLRVLDKLIASVPRPEDAPPP